MATAKKKKAADDSPFQRVWAILLEVPRGRVVTYGMLSAMIGRRLTPVGIGWAIRASPPGMLPWQRVVNGNGGISTDRHHPGLQREMLEKEGVKFGPDGLIDLARYLWQPKLKSESPARGARRSTSTSSAKAKAQSKSASRAAPGAKSLRK